MKRILSAALGVITLCSACDGLQGHPTQQAQAQQPPQQCAAPSESEACRTLASNRLALYDKPDTYPMSEKERHDAYVSLYTECMSGHDWQANSGAARSPYSSLSPAAGGNANAGNTNANSNPNATASAGNEYPTGSTVIRNTQNMPAGSQTSSYTSPGGSTVVVVQGTPAAPAGPAVIYAAPYGTQGNVSRSSAQSNPSFSDENSADETGYNVKPSRAPLAQNAPAGQSIVTFPQGPESAPAPAASAPPPSAPPPSAMSQTVIIRAPQIGQAPPPPPPPPVPMSQTVVIPPAQIEATMAPASAPPPPPAPMSQTVVIPPPQQAPVAQEPAPSPPAPMSQTVVIPPQQQAPVAQEPAPPPPVPMSQTVVIPPQQQAPVAQEPASPPPAPMSQTVVIPPQQQQAPAAQAPSGAPMAQTVVIPPAGAGGQNPPDYYAPRLPEYAPAGGSPPAAPDGSGTQELEQILKKSN